MQIKKHIPNLFTCLNLAVGVSAIISIFEGELNTIIYFIIAAGVFDFFDGFAARILKATSLIGKDLDSLADMVTFGVVPSLLMFVLIKNASSENLLPYVALLIAVCSALRLAKFNNDARQSDTFYGLPTPANAFIICSIPLLIKSDLPLSWLGDEIVMIVIVVISSLLMVSDIKLLALKFKNFGWKHNESRYILLLSSLGLLIYFGIIAIPLIIILYLMVSILSNTFVKS